PNTLAEVEAMKEVTEELDETFSLLEELDVTAQKEFPAYNISLYLKKPFINQRELELELEKFLEIYKWKTNNSLSGMKIQIYDRKEVFDRDLKPRATVYYAEKLTEEDLKDEEDGGTRERGEDTNEMNFQDTIVN